MAYCCCSPCLACYRLGSWPLDCSLITRRREKNTTSDLKPNLSVWLSSCSGHSNFRLCLPASVRRISAAHSRWSPPAAANSKQRCYYNAFFCNVYSSTKRPTTDTAFTFGTHHSRKAIVARHKSSMSIDLNIFTITSSFIAGLALKRSLVSFKASLFCLKQ